MTDWQMSAFTAFTEMKWNARFEQKKNQKKKNRQMHEWAIEGQSQPLRCNNEGCSSADSFDCIFNIVSVQGRKARYYKGTISKSFDCYISPLIGLNCDFIGGKYYSWRIEINNEALNKFQAVHGETFINKQKRNLQNDKGEFWAEVKKTLFWQNYFKI